MFSLTILTQPPIPWRLQVRSRLCLLQSSPCFFSTNTHEAPCIRLWNDHPDSLRVIQHATARPPQGEDDKSSCEASGSGCDGGFFCNHPTGDGGTCVMCPIEEASCEDFGEAVGACERNCFKREADGDVGTAAGGYPWCPTGGCCVDYFTDLSSPTLFRETRYACGCGWSQKRIDAKSPTCRNSAQFLFNVPQCGDYYRQTFHQY